MPEKVPFQIVTRGALRRAEVEAERRQAAIDNAASGNVQTANISTVTATAPSPQPSPTTPRDLNPVLPETPIRTPRRTRATPSRRSRIPHAGSTRPSTRRSAPYDRPARRTTARTPTTGVQAANGQRNASPPAEIIERGSVEGHDQIGQDPLIMNNQFVAENRDANDNQAFNQPVSGSIDQRSNRCMSALCPVAAEFPHDRGLYLHHGQPSQRTESAVFGMSNPPPSVWLMVDRILDGFEQPGDLRAINAFLELHEPLLGTVMQDPPSGTEDPPFGTNFSYEDFE